MNGNNEKIRCAIVGLGRIGSSLESDTLREKPCTHAGAIAANPECSLVGGCDIDPEARERFAGAKVFEDYDRMLTETRPEIVVVATYPESHRELTEKAVRADVPVIICEKPIARSFRDARAIARLHGKRKVKIVVNHERRYSRDYVEARNAVRDYRYGKLLSVKGTLCFGGTLPGRDVLLHDGTHMLDAINFLADARPGHPESAVMNTGYRPLHGHGPRPLRLHHRFGSMRNAEKSAFLFGKLEQKGKMRRTYDEEVPVALEIGSERDHLVFEIELSFERGRVKVGNGVFSFERSVESPYYEGYRSLLPDPDAPPKPKKTGYFAGMVEDAVRCLREPEHYPDSSAEDALEVMKFIRSVKMRW